MCFLFSPQSLFARHLYQSTPGLSQRPEQKTRSSSVKLGKTRQDSAPAFSDRAAGPQLDATERI